MYVLYQRTHGYLRLWLQRLQEYRTQPHNRELLQLNAVTTGTNYSVSPLALAENNATDLVGFALVKQIVDSESCG
jgi:hypothetical protein